MMLAEDRDCLQISFGVVQMFSRNCALRDTICMCAHTGFLIRHHLSDQLPDLHLQSCKKLPFSTVPFQPANTGCDLGTSRACHQSEERKYTFSAVHHGTGCRLAMA